MNVLAAAILAPLHETYFLKAMLGGSIVAIVCGVVGCFIVLRRMAFLGDALSHAMIAGVAGGYLFMKLVFGVEASAPAMLVGSILAAIVTVALIGFVSRVSRIKEDAAIGIMYCGVFAAGVVFVSVFNNVIHIDLYHFIMGDILGVTNTDLWVSAIVAATVLTVVFALYRTFLITSFDPVMAASIGIPVVLVDYLLTTCVSLVVVSAVSMVGVILVVGLLITPAATAYLLSDRLHKMMALAALFGVTSVVGGLYLCVWLDSAGGGAVVLFCTLQFLVVLTVAPRYGLLAGWLRRRRMVPQQLLENILVCLVRGDDSSRRCKDLEAHVEVQGRRLARALDSMAVDGLVSVSADGVSLTTEGTKEARRILRAHRLWEAYLEHVGTPAAEIHPRAHVLEHVHDRGTIDYIDELLGHPVRDPHGVEIPGVQRGEGENGRVPLAYLRSGAAGTISDIDAAVETDLTTGVHVTVGERRDDGATWVVVDDDGNETCCSHEVADRIALNLDAAD